MTKAAITAIVTLIAIIRANASPDMPAPSGPQNLRDRCDTSAPAVA